MRKTAIVFGEDANHFLALGVEFVVVNVHTCVVEHFTCREVGQGPAPGESCWSNDRFVHVFTNRIEQGQAGGFFCRARPEGAFCCRICRGIIGFGLGHDLHAQGGRIRRVGHGVGFVRILERQLGWACKRHQIDAFKTAALDEGIGLAEEVRWEGFDVRRACRAAWASFEDERA